MFETQHQGLFAPWEQRHGRPIQLHLFCAHLLDIQTPISCLRLEGCWCEGGARCVWISICGGFLSDECLDTQLMSLSASLVHMWQGVPLSCTGLLSPDSPGKERYLERAFCDCWWLYLLCRSWFHYSHIFYHLLSLPVVRIMNYIFIVNVVKITTVP